MILEGKGLVVRYPESERPALDGVDATLRDGELVAVVGPNGGGKTTLLRALLGAVPLAGGTATVEGVAVDALPRAALGQAGRRRARHRHGRSRRAGVIVVPTFSEARAEDLFTKRDAAATPDDSAPRNDRE